MICEDCGETNKPGTEFCVFCGAYLGWQATQPGSAATTQPLPAQTAPAGPSTSSGPAAAARPAGPASVRPEARAPEPTSPTPISAAPVARTPQATGTTTPSPTQVMPPVATATQTVPEAEATPICPSCSRPVEKGRRFCGHCGTQFIGPGDTGLPVTRPTATRDTWWRRFWNDRGRLAKREYRRSLPPLYRWRRVIIGVLTLGLLGGGLTLIGRSPKAFVLARYDDLRGRTTMITPITASTIPEDGSAQGTTPQALVDNKGSAWSMPWTAKTVGSSCGQPPTTPVVQLSFAERRVRKIEIRAGLLASNPNRPFQFRPQAIWIAYGDQCVPQPLDVNLDKQDIVFDTKVPVSSIRIGVQTALAPEQAAGTQPLLSITEIRLFARPRR